MIGILLVNLGTPEAPKTREVRRYLAEFLMDPRVLDIPTVARMLLLHGIILRTRPRKSAHAYQQVWDAERGSPLLFHSQDLADALQQRMGQRARVVLAMRYGQPDLDSALTRLQNEGCDRVVVVPLYPQYASSSSGSTLERVYQLAAQRPVPPSLLAVRDFYDHPGFIDAQVEVARRPLADFNPDHVLISFHGVPERHVVATDLHDGTHCLRSDSCCDEIDSANRACYRAQCFATARGIAAGLGLEDGTWSVAFQSRLGRIPWIRPYTDERVVELAQQGTRRLAVMCPSFVADCLETLEEIGIRAKEDFIEAGGEDLLRIDCVNSHDRWVDGLQQIIDQALRGQDAAAAR